MFDRVKHLFRNLLIYGLGDVATSLISLLLLPIFTRYLTPTEYGVITMLLTIEAVTKVLFRWGVDTAFMRLYYDCADQAARQRLASTIFFLLLAVNGTLVLAGVAGAGWLGATLIGTAGAGVLVAFTIVNIFIANFYFIPFQVLRIAGRSKQFIAYSFGRSAGTIVARLVFVIGLGMGVRGIVLADVIVTSLLAVALIPSFMPLIRLTFSRDVARQALGFGLPRIPHSVAQQVISVSDRYFLKAYGTLSDVGLYSIGASFGLALKLFLSAFESAWTPFFLGVMGEPNAQRIYSTVSTYVFAVLVLLVAGLCAVAPDVVALATASPFHAAAAVTPWIALGVMFQGLYLLGSIGLVITKRTAFYPIATGTAAAASLVANVVLIPRWGMMGAAWANVIAYATLAVVTSVFSWRVYPIHYEWSRLSRIVLAGALSYAAAVELVPAAMQVVPGLVLRGTVVVLAYGSLLFVVRFFHAGELRMLKEIRVRAIERRQKPVDAGGAVEMAGEILPAETEIPEDFEGDTAPRTPGPNPTRDSRGPRR